jgi:hypothetical protein
MTIWEENGITLDEYAKAFNEYQEKIFVAWENGTLLVLHDNIEDA